MVGWDEGGRDWEDWGDLVTVWTRQGPSQPELVAHGRGPEGLSPVAIVWQTHLSVESYEAGGRALEVPRFPCPTCGAPMRYSGWYRRHARAGASRRLWARRQLCKFCGVSHAVLPSFVTHGRLDAVGVIGAGLKVMAGSGGTTAGTARALGLPRSTLRAWRRRFAERAGLLSAGFARAAVTLGEALPLLPGEPGAAAIAALRAAWAGALRRFGGAAASLWRFANAMVGGHLLSTNTDPPWKTT